MEQFPRTSPHLKSPLANPSEPPAPLRCFPQENRPRGLAGSPTGSLGHETELAGSGTYMRFDVPRPKIKRTWPSFRGRTLLYAPITCMPMLGWQPFHPHSRRRHAAASGVGHRSHTMLLMWYNRRERNM